MTAVEITGLFGIVANITSNVAFVPQIIKSYRRKSVEDVSVGMFLILFFTQICWIVYGVPLHAIELVIASSIEILLLLPIFTMWWIYSRCKTHSSSLVDTPIEMASDI